MMSTGTFYGQSAEIEAVFNRFNSGTAYGHKMIGNTKDLQNLGVGQAVCRVERGDNDFNLAVTMSPAMDERMAEQRRQEIIVASRIKYGVPRAEIEAKLRRMVETETAEIQESKTRVRAVPVKDIPAVPAPPITPPAPTIVPAPPAETVISKPPPADLGRGGAQHQAIQQRLKQAAEALGFRAIIEKQILGGFGSIDLLLERGEYLLACEITIATSVDHEVGNVSKCFKAGFRQVAVIASDENRLRRIALAVESSLGTDSSKQVLFCLPDQLIAHLKDLPETTIPKPDQPKVRRGYKVTTKHVELSPTEMKAREDAAIAAIAEAMKQRAGKR